MACDLSAFFHTTDLGASWETRDFRQLQANNGSRVEFTSNPSILYCINFALDLNKPVKSTDGGATWDPLGEDPTGDGCWNIFADPAGVNNVIMSSYSSIFFSDNGGMTFTQKYTDAGGNGAFMAGAFFDGANIYVGTNAGVLVSTNGGSTFALAAVGGIPAGEAMVSFAGAKEGATVRFYCVTLGVADVFPGVTGADHVNFQSVYSIDWGAANWTARTTGIVAGDHPFFVGAARNNISTAYLAGGSDAGSPTVYKTTNGGANWQPVFQTTNNANIATGWAGDGGDRDWSYGEYALGFAVAPTDPNRAIITTLSDAHVTIDGGASWAAMYVTAADRNPANMATPTRRYYHGVGLEDTSAWWLTWFDASTMFASFSDIRGIRSADGGASWGFDYTGHTLNTMYHATKHPTNGNLYASTSSLHDMYQSTFLTDARIDGGAGRLLFSTDAGRTWQTLHDFAHPVIWEAIDPNNTNRMYASVIHSTQGGIYVTIDLQNGAASMWTKLTDPPRTQGHPFNIYVLNDGTLLSTFSGRRAGSPTLSFQPSSGVFISTNSGTSWIDRSDPGMLYWTKDVVIDPNDSQQNTWYACVWSGFGGPANDLGGLYKTTNRGQNWTRIFVSQRLSSCAINPSNPAEMYFTTETEGLWSTSNLTAPSPTFNEVASFTYRQPERVFYNPFDSNDVWVTSFGNGLRVGRVGAPTPTPTPSPTPTPTATPTPTPTATPPPTATPTPTPAPTPTSGIYVDLDNQTGNESGTALQPYNTIQEAVAAASAGENIIVAAGVYNQNVNVQDKAVGIWGGYPGGTPSGYASATPGDFSVRIPLTYVTEIRAAAMDATVTFVNAGASRVDGFKITNGAGSTYQGPTVRFGGGVFSSLTDITIANNVIENNDTRGPDDPNLALGGGVFVGGGTILIENNVIRLNFAGRGGGLAVGDSTAIIRDNLIEGNVGISDHGGGLYIVSPDVQVTHNEIRGNEIGRALGYGYGGGIIIFGGGSYVTMGQMSSNRVHDNFAPTLAGGVFVDDGAVVTMRNDVVYDNQGLLGNYQGGLGVMVDQLDPQTPSTLTMINCTIANNVPPAGGGSAGHGLYTLGSSATVRNCIFWGNGGDDFVTTDNGTITVTYTDSEESRAGQGNISADPLFANPAGGDFHERSTGGRWDPTLNAFVIDGVHSPAIDTGDPASAFSNETAPNGGRVNMGAYGNTAEASRAAGASTPTPSPTATPTPTGTPAPTPTPLALPATLDYTGGGGNANGWIGGALPGFGGSSSLGTSGLCMDVPGPGDNFVVWVSPERLLELVDNTLYRVRVTLSTGQMAADAIPLFFLVYDNFNTTGGGNNFGGFFWVLDVDGGAEGIGRAQGRTTFDFYFSPNPMTTPQWRTGAFTPQADAVNDIRLQYRIIDANPTLLTDNDSGTICISQAQLIAIPRDNLAAGSTVFNAAINTATHFAEANDEVGIGGTAAIDNIFAWARYALATTGTPRKTLGFFDPIQANLNRQLYPVPWEADSLYRVRARIRAESSEADPVDIIFLGLDTTTNELGMSQFSTRGAPGLAMDKAASPKLAGAEYEAYFFSQNATASLTPDAGRLRPLAFFFNAPDQGGGDGTGGDAFIVESLAVDKLVSPP